MVYTISQGVKVQIAPAENVERFLKRRMITWRNHQTRRALHFGACVGKDRESYYFVEEAWLIRVERRFVSRD